MGHRVRFWSDSYDCTVPIEPPPSPWTFPPVIDADPDGPAAIGGDLEPGTLLAAYRAGLFPMPVHPPGRTSAQSQIAWFSPDPRAIIPLDGLHVSRSLQRSMKKFEYSFDKAFGDVMEACADPTRPDGWITPEFRDAYERLHRLGWAHSAEVWHDGELVGGVYGVSIGSLFAGESMFHRVTDASKAALVVLVERLRGLPHGLFEVQWLTPHLESLGAIEISRPDYLRRLAVAISGNPTTGWGQDMGPKSSASGEQT